MSLDKPSRPTEEKLAELAIKVTEGEEAFGKARKVFAELTERRMHLQAQIDVKIPEKTPVQLAALRAELLDVERELQESDKAIKHAQAVHTNNADDLDAGIGTHLH